MAYLFKHFYPEGVTFPRCSQVEQMNKLNSFQGLSKMLDIAKAAEESSARRACYARLSHATSLWEMLIVHHMKSFQLNNFYTAEEAQAAVEKICSSLLAFAGEFNFGEIRIEDRVPKANVDDDRRALEERLGYILRLPNYCLDGFPEDVVEECEQARTVHDQQLSHWSIDDDEIVVGRCISCAVYTCMRRGWEYAVKKVLKSDGNHKDLVRLARLYTATKVSINSPAVVRLYGVTPSGKLVMELGEADMLKWFMSQGNGGMLLKLQLLQKAALALADVHHYGVVHGDIRFQKFIVFRGNPLEVKISVLEYSTNSSADANIVVTEAGVVKCGAPEVLCGAPKGFLSDIYSFGIVANMLVAEIQPCRSGAPSSMVSQRMAVGQPPWDVPSDCPEALAKLISECCSLDPAARPSSMEDVCERLTILADCYGAPRDTAVQNPGNLEEPLHELASAKYNKTIMGFLSQQLEKVHSLKASREASKDCSILFEKALETGRRLICKHEERVAIRTFYQSVEARDMVEHVCDSLYAVAREWGLEDRQNVEPKVPGAAFSADRDTLAKLLNFVLRGEHEASVGVAEIPKEWHDSRKEHVDHMKRLLEIDDDQISQTALVGEGGFSVVHSCTYKGKRVAMKEFVRRGGAADIENMADFFKDVLIQMSLTDGPVAKLIAITKSGRLLMELADMDLKAFWRKFRLKWPQQLRILLQAAKGLKYMHSRSPPMVHCDVKSPNFLVFGWDVATCTVKITDFGLACEATTARLKTARRPQGTCLWAAPEIFEGELISLASDVYSFGLVMYEVITGKELYGLQTLSQPGNNLHIMKKKLAGEEPCAVEASDCPKEMHVLMKECCHLDPTKRPTMADVCSRLSKLQDLQTDEVPDRTLMHRTLRVSVLRWVFFLFVSCVALSLAAIVVSNTIWGGRWIEVPAGRFDYFVSVRGWGWWSKHQCSGVVVDSSWVLTAAHCIKYVGLNAMVYMTPRVRGGAVADGATWRRVTHTIVHPDWNGSVEHGWDAALLHLHSPVHILGPTLVAPDFNATPLTTLITLAFRDQTAKMAKVTVVPNHQCPGLNDLAPGLLCISSMAQLEEGDSGGPALIAYSPIGPKDFGNCQNASTRLDLLVGIVSYTNLKYPSWQRGAVLESMMHIRSWILDVVYLKDPQQQPERAFLLYCERTLVALLTITTAALAFLWSRRREKHQRVANEMLAAGRVPNTAYHYVSRPALEQPAIDHLLKGLRDGSCRRVSIEGMPGYGKTTLAVAIIRGGHLADHFEDGVLWWNVRLHGSSAGRPLLHLFQDMHRHLLELFKRLAMSNGGSGCGAQNEKDFLMAINKLVRGKKFLLVLDSLRDKVVLREALELDCALIVTSQTRHALGEDDSVLRLQVGPLAEDEAYDLLCNVAGGGATHRAAAQILKVSEGHPLALSIMGKALGEAFELKQEDARREEIKELLELMANAADRMGLVMEDPDLLNVEAQSRHKMLYRCFDFALDGLGEDERRCLISLVVLPRGQSARVCDLQRLWGLACPVKTESRIRVLEERYLLHRWGDGTLGLKGLAHDYLVAISSTQPRYISMANGARNRFWGVGG